MALRWRLLPSCVVPRRPLALLVALVAPISLIACSGSASKAKSATSTTTSTTASTTTTTSTSTGSSSSSGPPPFVPKPLEFSSCGNHLECGTLTVPVDYKNPSGPTIDIAVNRAPARDADNRIGPLLVNPGGPG